MPQQRRRKVIPAEERLPQDILDEVESINGWHDFSKIERLTLLNRLQTSSHADAYLKARELSGLEPITPKAAHNWTYKNNRTEGFGLALNAISNQPERWRERLLAAQAAGLSLMR